MLFRSSRDLGANNANARTVNYTEPGVLTGFMLIPQKHDGISIGFNSDIAEKYYRIHRIAFKLAATIGRGVSVI
jgi:hypothetical protein